MRLPDITVLKSAIERLIAGNASAHDREQVQSAIAAGASSIATGERSVSLGGDANGAVIVTGDGNVILHVDGLSVADDYVWSSIAKAVGASAQSRTLSGPLLEAPAPVQNHAPNPTHTSPMLRVGAATPSASTVFGTITNAPVDTPAIGFNTKASQSSPRDDPHYAVQQHAMHRQLSAAATKLTPVPLSFLRGDGVPAIAKLPVQYHSCFISYSSKDEDFAKRVHTDLESRGVQCWFAPHDMKIGDKILDAIYGAIRKNEKLLLILSEHSIQSDWVEDEVTRAFEEEKERRQPVLFPLRIDDTVMRTSEPWAAKLRARHIGDFLRWKDDDVYRKSFERVLRDLQLSTDPGNDG
jgi:hypothetical protein